MLTDSLCELIQWQSIIARHDFSSLQICYPRLYPIGETCNPMVTYRLTVFHFAFIRFHSCLSSSVFMLIFYADLCEDVLRTFLRIMIVDYDPTRETLQLRRALSPRTRWRSFSAVFPVDADSCWRYPDFAR